MIRILLIRHGATDLLGRVLYGRMQGVNLNSQGFAQAEQLASVLNSRYKIASVISSPLDRALQTALPIAKPGELTIEIDEGITEIDFGSWMGKSFDELNGLADWKRYNHSRSTSQPPGGESMMEVQARAWGTLERVTQFQPSSNNVTVVVVTHGDVIRALILLLLGIPLDHIHRIEIAPASVTEVLLGSREPIVNRINEFFY